MCLYVIFLTHRHIGKKHIGTSEEPRGSDTQDINHNTMFYFFLFDPHKEAVPADL